MEKEDYQINDEEIEQIVKQYVDVQTDDDIVEDTNSGDITPEQSPTLNRRERPTQTMRAVDRPSRVVFREENDDHEQEQQGGERVKYEVDHESEDSDIEDDQDGDDDQEYSEANQQHKIENQEVDQVNVVLQHLKQIESEPKNHETDDTKKAEIHTENDLTESNTKPVALISDSIEMEMIDSEPTVDIKNSDSLQQSQITEAIETSNIKINVVQTEDDQSQEIQKETAEERIEYDDE